MFRRPAVVRRRGAPLLAAAAVGGVSYMAGKSMANKASAEADQDERLQDLERSQQYSQPRQPDAPSQQPTGQQAPAAASGGSGSSDRIARLKELGELRAAGVLTEPEFEIEKQRVLTS